MDSALAWIGQIAQWLGRFIPRKELLDTTENAIKYVNGEPKLCGPGAHWYWPWSSTWFPYPVARQTDRLETQTMETTDGITFLVSGTLTYQIGDLMLLIPTTHSPAAAVVDLAGTAMHDVCCEMSWAALKGEQQKGTLKTKLKNAAQLSLVPYGVKVLQLKLNTLARCRVYKVSQSTSSEEN